MSFTIANFEHYSSNQTYHNSIKFIRFSKTSLPVELSISRALLTLLWLSDLFENPSLFPLTQRAMKERPSCFSWTGSKLPIPLSPRSFYWFSDSKTPCLFLTNLVWLIVALFLHSISFFFILVPRLVRKYWNFSSFLHFQLLWVLFNFAFFHF
jgi:hypothetical protein